MNPRNRSRPERRTRALAARLARFDRLVEVGIGVRTGVAAALADRGARVAATDVRPRAVPDGVRFVRDDVTDPALGIYADAGTVYALNLPRELHRPTRNLAREVGAEFLFTTLGGEFPAVPAEPETLPDETLFRAAGRERGTRGDERGERA